MITKITLEAFSNNNGDNCKINEMPGKLTNIKYKINLLSSKFLLHKNFNPRTVVPNLNIFCTIKITLQLKAFVILHHTHLNLKILTKPS